ncbi:hypothetical protein HBH98_159450 [Parastagonospora nodorum]|nr:hypothetical protein HBH53_040840 [Parastagonospora nodorum]KAH4127139.1 hypothetical protein HBH47_050830 [Parastagonospora nodorum]KAH4274726.1 hypothetical protein HBI03_001020 [Parastagonospora nodorum]KAH4276197.1 hypothetical protein HBI04_119100 [Parastagonospora nodorum]KAH4342549.1 hypothetical protein HBH98_159450 [Parastagonospora nodorum]
MSLSHSRIVLHQDRFRCRSRCTDSNRGGINLRIPGATSSEKSRLCQEKPSDKSLQHLP